MENPKPLDINQVYSYDQYEFALKNMIRYKRLPLMFYRSNLFIHYHRMRSLLYFLKDEIQKVFPDFDFQLVEQMIMSHDDHELVHKDGDVQLLHKWKMSPDQLKKLKEEENAIHYQMVRMFPFKNQNYLQLLQCSHLKNCRESQLLSFLDKIDAYGEACHEVLVKNNCFVEPMINYWVKIFSRIEENYPLIQGLFVKDKKASKGNFFDFCGPMEIKDTIFDYFNGRHRSKSLFYDSGMVHYEYWKRSQMNDPMLIDSMLNKKEKRF